MPTPRCSLLALDLFLLALDDCKLRAALFVLKVGDVTFVALAAFGIMASALTVCTIICWKTDQ
jgi:hypothetical protein